MWSFQIERLFEAVQVKFKYRKARRNDVLHSPMIPRWTMTCPTGFEAVGPRAPDYIHFRGLSAAPLGERVALSGDYHISNQERRESPLKSPRVTARANYVYRCWALPPWGHPCPPATWQMSQHPPRFHPPKRPVPLAPFFLFYLSVPSFLFLSFFFKGSASRRRFDDEQAVVTLNRIVLLYYL